MEPVDRVPEPGEGDERSIVLGWLAFHRSAFEAKCAGLDAAALVARSAPPSRLSLLGLVRHLTEMERVYGAWALGPASQLQWVWGDYTDDGPEWDIDCDASMVEESMAAWRSERRAVDGRIAGLPDLSSVGRATAVRHAGTSRSSSASTRGTTGTPTCSASGSTARPANDSTGSRRCADRSVDAAWRAARGRVRCCVRRRPASSRADVGRVASRHVFGQPRGPVMRHP